MSNNIALVEVFKRFSQIECVYVRERKKPRETDRGVEGQVIDREREREELHEEVVVKK